MKLLAHRPPLGCRPGAPPLCATGVCHAYSGRPLYRDVSFEVRPGEIFVILGGSGSGKSTLMRQLIGLEQPLSGRIEVLGHDMQRPVRGLARRLGVMFQSGALFGSMSLLENVMLPLQVHTRMCPSAREAVARTKLALVGLADAASKQPSALSGGMVKRAGIARALALDPTIVFLDEPGAGLDPVTSAGLDALLLELRATLGATFVVISHELASILAIGDRCLMLDRTAGGVIATGNPRILRDSSDDPRVRAFFHREMAGAVGKHAP